MSTDLRNSIYLWMAGLAFFGIFWLLLKLDPPIPSPPGRLPIALALAMVFNLGGFLRSLWRRLAQRNRSSSS
jgi:hypothetical protein